LLLNLLKTNQTEKRKRVQICKWRIEEENRREKKGRVTEKKNPGKNNVGRGRRKKEEEKGQTNETLNRC
jgi:hypothetical protein|tara:strand:+ start:348 stop:554 length:207 start_codon:yes stop_codon:yes gene_type:complete